MTTLQEHVQQKLNYYLTYDNPVPTGLLSWLMSRGVKARTVAQQYPVNKTIKEIRNDFLNSESVLKVDDRLRERIGEAFCDYLNINEKRISAKRMTLCNAAKSAPGSLHNPHLAALQMLINEAYSDKKSQPQQHTMIELRNA